MRITVAGMGTVGRYAFDTFASRHDCRPYDPPLQLGTPDLLRDVDYVFVCVPTPLAAQGDCDDSLVDRLVASVSVRRAIIIQSTLGIGSMQRLAKLNDKVVYVPEYAGEASDHPYRDRARRKFFIFGGAPGPAEDAASLFREAYGEGARYHVVPAGVAEVVKYMENAYLATKVTFANEFFDLCASLAVPFEDVRRLWVEDERVGESHTHVTSERGFGG